MTKTQNDQIQKILSQGNPEWKGNWRKTQPINGNTIGYMNQIRLE